MSITKEQIQSSIKVVVAIADAIKELGEVPSGVLYANLCGVLSIEQYNSIIAGLKKAGVVSESGFLLTWVGPK